jgi:hypothetical protein
MVSLRLCPVPGRVVLGVPMRVFGSVAPHQAHATGGGLLRHIFAGLRQCCGSSARVHLYARRAPADGRGGGPSGCGQCESLPGRRGPQSAGRPTGADRPPAVGGDSVGGLHDQPVVLQLDEGHVAEEMPAVALLAQLGVRHGVEDDRVHADVDDFARRDPGLSPRWFRCRSASADGSPAAAVGATVTEAAGGTGRTAVRPPPSSR